MPLKRRKALSFINYIQKSSGDEIDSWVPTTWVCFYFLFFFFFWSFSFPLRNQIRVYPLLVFVFLRIPHLEYRSLLRSVAD